MIARELSITWTEAWLVLVSATGIYVAMVVLSRIFSQRQFLNTSSYDLAFTFAMGTLIGRTVLVRTSLAVAVLGLLTMFSLHAAVGFLHHRVTLVHRLMENRPVLLVARGEALPDGLRRARMSMPELRQQLRQKGFASLQGVEAAVLERDGSVSVVTDGAVMDGGFFDEVIGGQHLRR